MHSGDDCFFVETSQVINHSDICLNANEDTHMMRDWMIFNLIYTTRGARAPEESLHGQKSGLTAPSAGHPATVAFVLIFKLV